MCRMNTSYSDKWQRRENFKGWDKFMTRLCVWRGIACLKKWEQAGGARAQRVKERMACAGNGDRNRDE